MSSPLEDGISSVDLIDSLGGDLTVANAARVSLHKYHEQFTSGDAKLIQYLAEHGHWTPFSQVMLTFRIKMPIFVARQWFKHQVGFTRNEVSRRYVTDKPELYFPKKWRAAAPGVKQGSSDETIEQNTEINDVVREYGYGDAELYTTLLKQGVAPEMARMVLPQSTYTEFIETASLYAYARLYKLRIDPAAQWEVRQYAEVIGELVHDVAPISWEALW